MSANCSNPVIQVPSESDNKRKNHEMPIWDMNEDIVISGIAGRFPESDNIDELKKNLFDGVDLITEDARRWEPGLLGLPRRHGKINGIDKFDSDYFGIPDKEAEKMDPQLRILLEVVYETIADAGYSTESMRGKNVAVFVGQSTSELQAILTEKHQDADGLALTGCSNYMLPNKVSFYFDFKGPSMSLDTACSSSITAFHQAMLHMRSNQCEAAIVAGVNVNLNPMTSLEFKNLGMLAMDGKCKVFDDRGDGYVRSETVAALLLQRSSDARRIYVKVLHSKINADGAKEDGITYPSSEVQKQLLQSIYGEAKIKPKDVPFMECHGTGTKAGDPIELKGVTEVFCKDRKEPLLIGAVKSNLGHPEAASGLVSLAKIVIAMESGYIPPNLHYENPNKSLKGILDGRLKVVTTPHPLDSGSIVAFNCFGFGGANAHLILRGNRKIPDSLVNHRKIPRLTLYCGRTAEAVDFAFSKMVGNKFTDEALSMVEDFCKAPVVRMPYRGYALIKDNEDEPIQLVELAPTENKPIWFLFSGVGSQWPGMAKDMMQLDVFANSIRESAQVVKPYGIDLVKLVANGTELDLLPVTACFVSIAAVQIALIDILFNLGIEPDGIVGHSAGELACAYADGGLTAKQTLMTAYWRGQCCLDCNVERGAMAAVGLSWEEVKKRCPEGIVPACHNAEDSVTVSGPVGKIKKFIESLLSENIFVKEVNSCHMPFHSPYMKSISQSLREALNKVITYPKLRTPRWISSSIQEADWNKPLARMSSTGYFVNNMIAPVLFHEALNHVPKNAIVIEIAPHGLLQAIIKRRMGKDCTYVSMLKRNHPNNIDNFLSSIGNLYNLGLNPKVKNLYPPLRYPVPNGTPSISSIIHWDHSHSWKMVSPYDFAGVKNDSESVVEVDCSSPSSPDYYITGHNIDGRVLYPATGYLMLAWKALAKAMSTTFERLPVVFENVNLHRATMMPKEGIVRFTVNLMQSSGKFEIIESGSKAVTGRVYVPDDLKLTMEDQVKRSPLRRDSANSFNLNSKDFYKELRLRGYEYGPTFQGVLEVESTGLNAKLLWNGNWVTFMDTMLQFSILSANNRLLNLPTNLRRVVVNPGKMISPQTISSITAYYDPYINACTAGAIEMEGLTCTSAPRRYAGVKSPILEEYTFVPNTDANVLSRADANKLKEYIEVCNSVTMKILEANAWNHLEINKILNGQNIASDDVVKCFMNEENENYHLLEALKKVLKASASQEKKSSLEELTGDADQRHSLSRDILSNTLLCEKALRASLDLVIENTPNVEHFQILEAAVDHTVASNILNLISTYHANIKTEYTLGQIGEDFAIDTSFLGETVQTLKWNLMSQDGPSERYDLIVAKDVFKIYKGQSSKTCLQSMRNAVKNRGFMILIERTHLTPGENLFSKELSHRCIDIEEICEEIGCVIVGKKTDNLTATLYILRKLDNLPTDLAKQRVVKVNLNDYSGWIENLKETIGNLVSEADGENLWIVSDKPIVGIVGLVNCLLKEVGCKKIRCVFDNNCKKKSLPEFDLTSPFYADLMKKDLVMNINNEGQWGTFRHFGLPLPELIKTEPTEHAYLNILTRGDLSSFKWFQSSNKFYIQRKVRDEGPLCQVYYSSLNFKDVMLATGKITADSFSGDFASEECVLGLEYAGRETTPNGRRIMGIVGTKGLATSVIIDKSFVWSVPDDWTLEQASTIPVVYATTYYALIMRGKMKPGESILIHSGSGGVGQAAISIALSMGCQVFTTVGSIEKREYLKKRFPQLNDRNFSSSRDIMFEYDILKETNSRGVDLVLNSLAEEKLQASVRCLAQYGRFLEIGKFDLSQNNPLGMSAFLKGITFHGVLLDALFVQDPVTSSLKKELHQLVQEGIENGTVQPLDATVFRWDQVEDAFRFMASGKHIGKVVLKIRDEEKAKFNSTKLVQIPAVPRSFCHPDMTYIIVGGLGGFGLELGNWLIARGCKNLVVTSRSGIKTGYQKLCVKRWLKNGTVLDVSSRDVVSISETEELIRESSRRGPIGGVFNLALVLKDALFENQTVENFTKVTDPKVKATINLDKVTRAQCPNLEWFVTFSSIACGRGNAGQTNYGFANSVMERICEKRRMAGFPGLAIQWGVIGDVGIVHETMGSKETVIGGFTPQRISNCLSTLDYFLQISTTSRKYAAVLSSFVPAEHVSETGSNTEKKDLVKIVGRILGLKDMSSISSAMTLGELGLDSLMGVEVKQAIERNCGLNLSMQEIRNLSIKNIIDIGSGCYGK